MEHPNYGTSMEWDASFHNQSCYDSLFFTQFKTMLPWLRIESDFKLGIIYRLANEQKLISSTIQFNMRQLKQLI